MELSCLTELRRQKSVFGEANIARLAAAKYQRRRNYTEKKRVSDIWSGGAPLSLF